MIPLNSARAIRSESERASNRLILRQTDVRRRNRLAVNRAIGGVYVFRLVTFSTWLRTDLAQMKVLVASLLHTCDGKSHSRSRSRARTRRFRGYFCPLKFLGLLTSRAHVFPGKCGIEIVDRAD